MMSFVDNAPSAIKAWLQIIALAFGVATSTGIGIVKVLGLETAEQHAADINALEQKLDQIDRTLQCLLWEVPAQTCGGSGR